MNYNKFLNQPVMNKAGEKGIVVAFDKDHIVVKYENSERTYSTDITFKNKFIFFFDDELQKTIDDSVKKKENELQRKEQEFADNHKRVVALSKKVNSRYQQLSKKNNILLHLFGKDFVYPPYQMFVKKYKYIIIDKKKSLFKSRYRSYIMY